MSDTRGRRASDPLKVLVFLLLLAAIGFVVYIALDDPPPTHVEEPQLPEVGAPVVEPVAPPDDDALAKLDKKPATTKKGKLMKSALKKKLAEDAAKKPQSEVTKVAMGGGPAVALSGDAAMKKAFARKLRGTRVLEERAIDRGHLLSLRSDTGAGKGGAIYAKCSAAISELPQRKLVASLSARADVSGDGMNHDELKAEAKDACAASLADDVGAWLRANR